VEVGVRALRMDLSRLLDRVRQGEEIVVTDRGRPVARLVAVEAGDILDGLAARGLVSRPASPRRRARDIAKVKATGSVSDLVAEQRR
jgi:prevent-host-death family protein